MSDSRDDRRGLPSRLKMRHDTHFVEELASRHVDPIGQRVDIGRVEPDPDQPRSRMGELDDLVSSIREKGILEPILVREVSGGEPGIDYRIISGERRYRAALEAELTDLPVIVLDVDPDEALEIALIENLQRKDLTPFEEAQGFHALAERHQYTHQEIASAVGRSRSLVSETLKLLEMPEDVRRMAERHEVLSRSMLLEILKASGGDEEAMLRLIEQAAHGTLRRDDVRDEIRSRKPRASARRKPYTFKFRDPEKSFHLALSFRRSEVERSDLISALEQILGELRRAEVDDVGPAAFGGEEREEE